MIQYKTKSYSMCQLAFYKIINNVPEISLCANSKYDKIIFNGKIVGFYSLKSNKVTTKHGPLIDLLNSIIEKKIIHDPDKQIVFN